MLTAFVVDDHRDSAESLALLLEIEGFYVRKFHEFESAYGEITEVVPCIALLDVHVPGTMDATSFCANVKKHFPSLPLIVLSGDPRQEALAHTFGASFMLKPFNVDTVIAEVGKACPRTAERMNP